MIIVNIQDEAKKPWDDEEWDEERSQFIWGDKIPWIPPVNRDLTEADEGMAPEFGEGVGLFDIPSSPPPANLPSSSGLPGQATSSAAGSSSSSAALPSTPPRVLEPKGPASPPISDAYIGVDGYSVYVPDLDKEELYPSDALLGISHDYIRNVRHLHKTQYYNKQEMMWTDKDVQNARKCIHQLGLPERFLEGAWDGEEWEDWCKRYMAKHGGDKENAMSVIEKLNDVLSDRYEAMGDDGDGEDASMEDA